MSVQTIEVDAATAVPGDPGERAELPPADLVEQATPAESAGDQTHSTGRLRKVHPLVWVLRLPLMLPFVFMAPEFVSVALGRSGAIGNVSSSAADVLGTSSFLFFITMLAVTPVQTMTGWRWHRPLRRDYGIAMFVVAATDLLCAATVTGDTFPGGFLTRVGGHTFLLAGTLATLLLVPLALTASRRAQRWLGPHWKRLHRLVYVIWAVILIHLAFLFALRTIFIDALLVSAPLALLRVPAVRDRWIAWRKQHVHRVARWSGAFVLVGVFGAGYLPLVHELFHAGVLAFTQHPTS